ncbi:hypothetical protein EVAR_85600_1 [Eumeta japonica]|uniref:Uncharacterized protein n=1 Tax=Eumeta variegata TaxID=151549 RepID=A0A4C1XSU4_EUMVA|nr:hypothetical protein EVAR_85600_1 [Eumeta japonica]
MRAESVTSFGLKFIMKSLDLQILKTAKKGRVQTRLVAILTGNSGKLESGKFESTDSSTDRSRRVHTAHGPPRHCPTASPARRRSEIIV